MKTLYDVQQLLKRFGIYIHMGKRLYDIELMMLELKNLEKAGLVTKEDYLSASLVLKREHRLEESRETENLL